MINLTAKKIQLAIKNGLTFEETANKYEITPEQLENQIKHIYSAGDGSMAKQAIKNLKANRKKAKKAKETEPAEDITSEVPTEPVEVAETVTEGDKTPERSLEELRKTEEFLVSRVICHESNHKEFAARHRVCIKELRSLQEQIEEIKKSLENSKKTYEEVIEKADEIAKMMNEVSSLRREELEALERVRQEIEARTTIVIYAYGDGTIEAPDSPEFILNDEGYLDIKSKIADREECLDLRVRDITTLARLIKICENVEHLTLICEDEGLEKAFWAINS